MNNVTLDYFKKSIASLVAENKSKPPDFLHEMFLKPLWLNDAINMGLFWVVRWSRIIHFNVWKDYATLILFPSK